MSRGVALFDSQASLCLLNGNRGVVSTLDTDVQIKWANILILVSVAVNAPDGPLRDTPRMAWYMGQPEIVQQMRPAYFLESSVYIPVGLQVVMVAWDEPLVPRQ